MLMSRPKVGEIMTVLHTTTTCKVISTHYRVTIVTRTWVFFHTIRVKYVCMMLDEAEVSMGCYPLAAHTHEAEGNIILYAEIHIHLRSLLITKGVP